MSLNHGGLANLKQIFDCTGFYYIWGCTSPVKDRCMKTGAENI